ncbi:MAG: ATP-binding protein [Limnochordia bacterium]
MAGGDHFGLYGMRERVELLGGVFRIRSKKGEGTRVSVVIPLKQKG